MLPYLQIYRLRPRKPILGTYLRSFAFPGTGWAVYAFLGVLGLTSEALAQKPQEVIPPFAAAKSKNKSDPIQ